MTALTTRLGLRTGGREYLLKPVSETTLRETLRKFFFMSSTNRKKDASPFETSLRVWIAQHYTEDITLDDAAESMGMSTFYFSRQVKVLTGHTFLRIPYGLPHRQGEGSAAVDGYECQRHRPLGRLHRIELLSQSVQARDGHDAFHLSKSGQRRGKIRNIAAATAGITGCRCYFLHKISTRIFNVGGKLAVVAQKFTLS